MHDTITVGVPVLAILFGILLNQRGIERLEARIDKLSDRVDRTETNVSSRLDRVQADLAQFYRTLGEHDAKIEVLTGRDKPKP